MLLKAKTSTTTVILKEILKAAREEKGLSQEELGNLVCLKKWHIKEIEESDLASTFYSSEIKLQAAKKIGNYFGLEPSQFLEVKIL